MRTVGLRNYDKNGQIKSDYMRNVTSEILSLKIISIMNFNHIQMDRTHELQKSSGQFFMQEQV